MSNICIWCCSGHPIAFRRLAFLFYHCPHSWLHPDLAPSWDNLCDSLCGIDKLSWDDLPWDDLPSKDSGHVQRTWPLSQDEPNLRCHDFYPGSRQAGFIAFYVIFRPRTTILSMLLPSTFPRINPRNESSLRFMWGAGTSSA